MRSEKAITAIANKEFVIALLDHGVGGYLWMADYDTEVHFRENLVSSKTENNKLFLSYKFDGYPPLHRLTFVKLRPWEGETVRLHDYFVTVYPSEQDAAIAVARQIRETEERFARDSNSVVRMADKPRGLFS